jgi:hypothetical protein
LIFDLGIIKLLNHVSIQLFVADIKLAIRDEIMKGLPVVLWDAFQQALPRKDLHAPQNQPANGQSD